MKAAENLAATERTASFNIKYGVKEHKLTVTQGVKEDADITAHFDAKFAAKLQERGYIPDATKILFSDVRNITTVNIEETAVLGDLTSLAGIEYFKALTNLNLANNQVTTLDLSENTALTGLTCYYNKLTTLELSKNIALDYLSCFNNQLTFLDLSKNTALKDLDFQNNKLTAIDLSNNTLLETFFCHKNQLTALDLSKNTALTWVICISNQITTIDVSKCTVLKRFNCSINKITAIDVSNSPALTSLLCFDNKLVSLDISNNRALNDFYYKLNPGDGTLFVIKAWFDNDNIPPNFPKEELSWVLDGKTITVDYQKVN